RAVFDELVFKEVVVTNPVAAVQGQVKAPSRAKIVEHFKSLPWAQARTFYRGLDVSEAVAARCIQWVMLTACRTSEALGLVPDELDLKRGLWVVPAERMKAKRPHTVYLSSHAVQLAERMLKLGTPYLFPSPNDDQQPLSNAAMLQLLDRLGYRGQTTIHGLRSTFSTWANEHNFRPDVVEVSLAHQEGDRVRKAYNHAVYVEQRLTLM
ncbi:MAG: tyrosine-type recombinase/integrase, partial [Limnobacter sp.]